MRLIGDLPFFVSPDSSDVWANPELFLLDEQHRPRFVAGCLPTTSAPRASSGAIRSTTGTHCVGPAIAGASTGCALAGSRGSDSAGSFPRVCGGLARSGRGTDGPDRAIGCRARRRVLYGGERELGALPFIAEDLGMITPDVRGTPRPVSGARHTSPSVCLRRPSAITPICLTIMFRIRWCTRAPTTITRRAAGSKSCRMTNGKTCGITCKRPAATATRPRRAVAPGVVVGRGARDGSAAGSAEPGGRGPHERARSCRRQLALALDRRHAVRARFRMAAGPDGNSRTDRSAQPPELHFPLRSYRGNTP